MARPGNYPTTYEERKPISITDLRKGSYLLPDTWRSGTISWSRNGIVNSSVSIVVDMTVASPYLELNYKWQEQTRKYRVPLIQVLSNLGTGNIWYFLCQLTNKRCRKLYLIDGYFQHREAIKGYYEKQIQSKHYRYLEKVYGPVFKVDELYRQLSSLHFRKFYNGKPTKRYLKIIEQIKAAKSLNERDLVSMLVKGK
ncbi:hypothetical protein [Chitinophaga arvensicola]|uniref:Uncharacterized protein n=1 Tax=Chitinophaga arvensicola TaxID=29529 RepID=A0A1I0QJE1_9BACT|nr:hypothetical protein [Chitinophaga arvensicola]SEW27159.1 hypothetical protein SAMN04488122_1510 [Chitinophaga arvensicola]